MDVAYALQKNLEYESDPTVWDQGVFRPMRQTLYDLASEAAQTDFALFVFAPDFLNTMSEALLAGRLYEARARPVFEQPLRSVWARAHTYLAPLDQADEAWEPLPAIAELDRRWRRDSL